MKKKKYVKKMEDSNTLLLTNIEQLLYGLRTNATAQRDIFMNELVCVEKGKILKKKKFIHTKIYNDYITLVDDLYFSYCKYYDKKLKIDYRCILQKDFVTGIKFIFDDGEVYYVVRKYKSSTDWFIDRFIFKKSTGLKYTKLAYFIINNNLFNYEIEKLELARMDFKNCSESEQLARARIKSIKLSPKEEYQIRYINDDIMLSLCILEN